MGLCISHLRSTGTIGYGAISSESQRQSRHTTSIHILDDDSLLHVFYLYRPFVLGEDDDDIPRFWGGRRIWDGEHWWYALAHVCQRWRSLILGSASYLRLSLFCTNGTPVASMLEYSPPLPLVIDYYSPYSDTGISPEDEEGTILALKQRDRVRRVRLLMPVTSLQKLIAAMDEEYPILEYLVITRWVEEKSIILVLPETLQAPHLRHLVLNGFALPMGSRLLTTAVGLVTLYLVMGNPSTYFHPNTLLRWLSFMPQLETLMILFSFPVPYHDAERRPTHMPIMTPVTLPNLRFFWFRGVSAYLEALVHRITAPRLERLEVFFFSQLTYYVPHLLRFMNTTENLRFDSAKVKFSKGRVRVEVYLREEAKMYALSIWVDCQHLDWQVSSVAQIFNSLGQMFYVVEHLILEREVHSRSSEEHDEVDPIEWRRLLSSFMNMKTLRIDKGLVEELHRCLQSEDGELPLGLLPELQELTYPGTGDTGNAFTSFVEARQNAARPITLVCSSPRTSPIPWRSQLPGSDPSSSVSSLETTPITPANNEVGGEFES